MNIGELSHLSGVPAPTIRFYEKIALLPKAKRLANGYRDYSDDDVVWLALIQGAQQVGFALEEIKALFPLDEKANQQELVLARLQQKMAEIDAQMLQLQADKQKLQRVMTAVINKPADVSCSENAQRLPNHASGLRMQSQYRYHQVFFIGQVAVKQFAIGVHGRLQLLCQGGRGGVGALQL